MGRKKQEQEEVIISPEPAKVVEERPAEVEARPVDVDFVRNGHSNIMGGNPPTTKAEVKALLARYKEQNPVKYALKEASGEFSQLINSVSN